MNRLVWLFEYPSLHGGERSLLVTLAAVRAAGFDVAALAPPQGPLAEALRSEGVEPVPFVAVGDDGRRLPPPRLREELARLLRSLQPGLLHANSLAMGRLSGPVAAEAGLASLAHLRDIVGLSRQGIADLARHDRLLAVSRATRDFHVAAGLDAGRTHVLYNGVDLERFRPRTPAGFLHRELHLPPAARLAATIGQIGLRKGQDVLLAAARPLAAEVADVHFLIVGGRWSQKDEALAFERALHRAAGGPLAGRVHWLGVRDDLPKLLAELTLLVHPARQEPLGRVLLEAAASAVAVVATAVGGTPEIFPPAARAARLVPCDDPPALAGAVRELLADPAARTRLGRAARCRVAAAFSADAAAADLVRHYREVLGG